MKQVVWIIVMAVTMASLFACDEDVISSPEEGSTTNRMRDTTLVDVTYGNDPRQTYDVYLPADRGEHTPVIVMLHGGAWSTGQKELLQEYVARIRAAWKEVAIVNMNYRLASNEAGIHHEEIMQDITDALQHIKSNQLNYHIGEKYGFVGESAGAQLAMIYAYRYDESVACVASIYGPTIINDWSWYNSNNIWLGGYTGDILATYVGQPWDTTAYKAVSPFWQVSAKSAPTILFHGSLDPIVPVYQSQWMDGKLGDLGVAHDYHEYFAVHKFEGEQANDVVQKLVAFFKKYVA
jgi:acetyl esterase/lipase